ncbi:MAG: rod shape-determining protein MreD [Sphaerobacter sp.]|nr:rod shape-determining protein MreD [Sphaerobacter sp.]
MTRLFFALVLTSMAYAQTTVFPAINVLGIGPNLILVLVLVWSGLRGAPEGLLWVFPLGLLLDLLTLNPLGSSGLALVPVALIGGLARRRLFHSGLIIPLVAVVAATLAHQLVSLVVALLAGTSYPLLVSVRLALLTALLNVVVVPPLYLVVVLLDRMGVGRAAQA